MAGNSLRSGYPPGPGSATARAHRRRGVGGSASGLGVAQRVPLAASQLPPLGAVGHVNILSWIIKPGNAVAFILRASEDILREVRPMMAVSYRIRFFDHVHGVFRTISFLCDSDGEAIEEAHRSEALTRRATGFEIWQDDRLVYPRPN